MKIGYFDTHEFASKDGAESPWPCIVDHTLIELCNKIREELGCAIVVNSGSITGTQCCCWWRQELVPRPRKGC